MVKKSGQFFSILSILNCSWNAKKWRKISFENYENFWWKNMNPEWMDHDGSYCHHGNVLKHSKTSFLFPTHTVCHIRYINHTVLLIQSYAKIVRLGCKPSQGKILKIEILCPSDSVFFSWFRIWFQQIIGCTWSLYMTKN